MITETCLALDPRIDTLVRRGQRYTLGDISLRPRRVLVLARKFARNRLGCGFLTTVYEVQKRNEIIIVSRVEHARKITAERAVIFQERSIIPTCIGWTLEYACVWSMREYVNKTDVCERISIDFCDYVARILRVDSARECIGADLTLLICVKISRGTQGLSVYSAICFTI